MTKRHALDRARAALLHDANDLCRSDVNRSRDLEAAGILERMATKTQVFVYLAGGVVNDVRASNPAVVTIVDRTESDGSMEVDAALATIAAQGLQHPSYLVDEDTVATTRVENHYTCPGDCVGRQQHEPYSWTDQHDCACNDHCHVCNAEIEPTESVPLAA